MRIATRTRRIGPLHELVDDRALVRRHPLPRRDRPPRDDVRRRPVGSPRTGARCSSSSAAPARDAPTSLAGQLRYVRARWGEILGDALDVLLRRLVLTIGILAEEERALHLRFGGGTAVRAGAGRPRRPPPGAGGDEPEAFSSDSAWMPGLVLIAKSTHVWLDQLSRRYGPESGRSTRSPTRSSTSSRDGGDRPVAHRPVAALRSGSQRIKIMRGNADAAAQRVLAGRLPDRRGSRRRVGLGRSPPSGLAARHPAGQRHGSRPHGHRLALGHRPPGVVPDVPQPPYPAYTYTGADLSPDELSGSSSRTTTGTTATPRSCSSASTARPATSATSTTATTARASRGTTRPSSTSTVRRPCGSR